MLLTSEILQKLGRCQLIAQRVVEGLPLTGVHRSRRPGAALEFQQYRSYAPGDDLRQLDWRLFARTDQLAIRVQTPETPFRLGVVLDASASMEYQGQGAPCTKMRYAAILAACMGYLASRQGDETGLFLYQEAKLPSSGLHLSWNDFCDRLDALKPAGKGIPQEALEHCGEFLGRKGVAVWISDFLEGEEHWEKDFRGLQASGCGCLAVQVLDEDEVSFPFQAFRRFQDPENIQHRVDVSAERIREEYLQRFREHQELLKRICAAQEVSLLQMTTKDDPASRLVEFLLRS